MKMQSEVILILATVLLVVRDSFCNIAENGVCKQDMTNKEAYNVAKQNLVEIRKSCGEICETDIEIERSTGGKFYKSLKKRFDCEALWSNPLIDEPSRFCSPPSIVPKWLKPQLTYNGRVGLEQYYFDAEPGLTFHVRSNILSKKGQILELKSFQEYWTKQSIEDQMEYARKGWLAGSYGKAVLNEMKEAIDNYMDVKDKHILVIGSEKPWIEVLLLLAGAQHVTAFDYNTINTNHPQVTALTPMQLREMVLNGTAPTYDGMISFSSIEHSGLARYGDQLNPWGDLITMARAWCILKPGARAIVGVPAGKDTVCFNAHRFYGPIMLPHLFANWDQIYSSVKDAAVFEKVDCIDYSLQPLHVLEKPKNTE